MTFVGPSAEAIAAMGDKAAARRLARDAGVPVVPGTDASADAGAAARGADEVGYPVMVKAAAGGGGRGIGSRGTPTSCGSWWATPPGRPRRPSGTPRST